MLSEQVQIGLRLFKFSSEGILILQGLTIQLYLAVLFFED